MKNLVVFGCSYTEPFFDWTRPGGIPSPYTLYKNWLGGEFPLTWSELLANKLGYKLKNFAKGGSCNYRIMNRFNRYCNEIEEGDLVIVQWTHIERFWISDHDKFSEVVSPDLCVGKQDFNEVELQKILVHRKRKNWTEEVYDYMNLLNYLSKLGKYDIFYWSACDSIINGESHDFKSNYRYLFSDSDKGVLHYLRDIHSDILTIDGETNKEVFDIHFGKIGHEVLFNEIYKDLKNKNFVS